MEAVKFPMVYFFLRTCSAKVEFKETLLQLISQNFYDDASGYVRECTEFDHLRSNAVDAPWDFTGCNTLKKYYCQLCYLLNRFPFLEGTQVTGLDFTWENEYTDDTDTSSDIQFERSNILYNIAAIHSYLGAQDNRSTSEGMQTSCTHFQAAAGALKTLQEKSASVFSSQFTSEILLFQEQLMLAQAQECILEKAMSDGRKAAIIAKVAVQCSEFYKRSLEYMDKNISVHNNQFGSKQVKTWRKYLELKISYHKCVMYYYLCIQCEEAHEYGDRVTYSLAAADKLTEITNMSNVFWGHLIFKFSWCFTWVMSRPRRQPNDFVVESQLNNAVESCNWENKNGSSQQDLIEFSRYRKSSRGEGSKATQDDMKTGIALLKDIVIGKRDVAKKENDFIYHGKVPPLDSLPPIKGAVLAKGAMFDINNKEIAGADIFHKLVPIEAHETSSVYSEEKAKLLREVQAEIEQADTSLAEFLASIQITPDQLNPVFDHVPDELVEKCAAISLHTEIMRNLNDAKSSLTESSQNTESDIKLAQQVIAAERQAEEEFQAKHGKRAELPTLDELSAELDKFKTALVRASASNRDLDKYVQHIELLASGLENVKSQLPNPNDDLTDSDMSVMSTIRRLFSKIDEMRQQRVTLVNTLKQQLIADDITKQIVNQQNVNQKAYFTEQLKKHDDTRQYIQANLDAQPRILGAITENNVQYVPIKQKLLFKSQQRTARIEELLYSYSIYEDLLDKLRVGIEWHQKLHHNVKSVQEEVGKLHRERTEQRESMIKASKPKVIPPSRPAVSVNKEAPSRPSPSPSPSTGPPRLKDYLPFMKVGGSASSAISAVSTLSDEIPDDFDIDDLDEVEVPAADTKPRLKDFIPFMNKPSNRVSQPSAPSAPQSLPAGLSDLPPEALKYLPAEFQHPKTMGIPPPSYSPDVQLQTHPGGPGAHVQRVSMGPPQLNIRPPLSNVRPPLSNVRPPLSNVRPPLANVRSPQPNMQPPAQTNLMRPPVQSVSMPPNLPSNMPPLNERPPIQHSTPHVAGVSPAGQTMVPPPEGLNMPPNITVNQSPQGYSPQQTLRGPAPALPPKSIAQQIPYAHATQTQQPGIPAARPQEVVTPHQVTPQPNLPHNIKQAGQTSRPLQPNQLVQPQHQLVTNSNQLPLNEPSMQPGLPRQMHPQQPSTQMTLNGMPPGHSALQTSMSGSIPSNYPQQLNTSGGQMSMLSNQVTGPFSTSSLAPSSSLANSVAVKISGAPFNPNSTIPSSVSLPPHSTPGTGANQSSGPGPRVSMSSNTALTTQQQLNNVSQQNLPPQNSPSTVGTPFQLPHMQQPRLPPTTTGPQHTGFPPHSLPSSVIQPVIRPSQSINPGNRPSQNHPQSAPIMPGRMNPSNTQQIPGPKTGPTPFAAQGPTSQTQTPATFSLQTGAPGDSMVRPTQTNPMLNQQGGSVLPQNTPNTIINTSVRPPLPQGGRAPQPSSFRLPNQSVGAGVQLPTSSVPLQAVLRPGLPVQAPTTNQSPSFSQIPIQRPQFNQPQVTTQTPMQRMQRPSPWSQQQPPGGSSQGPTDLLSSGVCVMSEAVMVPQSPTLSSGRSTPLSSVSQQVNNPPQGTQYNSYQSPQSNVQKPIAQPPQPGVQQTNTPRHPGQPPQPNVQPSTVQPAQPGVQPAQPGVQPAQPGVQQSNNTQKHPSHPPQLVVQEPPSARVFPPTGQQLPAAQDPALGQHGPRNTTQGLAAAPQLPTQPMLPGAQQACQSPVAAPSLSQPTQNQRLNLQASQSTQRPVQSVAPTPKLNSHIDDMAGMTSSSINPNEIGTFIDWSKATEKPKQTETSLKPAKANNSKNQRDVREPYSDESSLASFTESVERYQKQIDSLTKASLMGPRPLDKQWQDLLQEQERESKRNSTAAALSEATRNRCRDAVPYDKFRVVLLDQKNDYINASLIDNMVTGCPRVIATQGPLHQTETDFWTMIVQQKVEVIVNLSHWSESDCEEGVRYWPRDRNDRLSFGNYLITLLLINNHKYWIERKINITNLNTKDTHVVTQLHYNNWPKSGLPDTMSLLMFINEVAVYYSKQRKSDTPITVHCGDGVTKTGVFCTLYTGIYNINSGDPIPDFYKVVTSLRQRRKGLVSNIEDYLFCHKALLYYMQDILIKKGILISHASFSNPLPQPGNSGRNASADFIMSDTSLASLGGWYSRQMSKSNDSSLDDQKDTTPNKSSSASAHSHMNTPVAQTPSKKAEISQPAKQTEQTNITPITTNTVTSGGAVQENPSQSVIPVPQPTHEQPPIVQTHPLPASNPDQTNQTDKLATLTDPNTFNIGQGRQRISKADFFNPSARPKVEDPNDPFSSIDAMWSIGKTS